LLRAFFDKIKLIWRAYAQVILVFAAFAAMIYASYYYISHHERENLSKNTENALSRTISFIEVTLLRAEAIFDSACIAIEHMLGDNIPEDMVRRYMDGFTHTDEHSSIYGCFPVFGGVYIEGGDWVPGPGYVPQERPWYIAALEARGGTAFKETYDVYSDEVVYTYARALYSPEGDVLCVIAIDVYLGAIRAEAAGTHFSEGSYGILLNADFNIIAHPIDAYLGRSLYLLNDGALIAADLLAGKDFGEYDARSYKDEPSTLSFKRLDNGWFMGIITPQREYYASVRNMARYLSILGACLALLLSVVLLRVSAARVKSDLESRQKSHFLATVSHEIRTPLNAIIGVAEIELMNKSLQTGLRESLLRIHTSGLSLLSIINDLLDLSKIEAGKMEISPARYDVASLVSDVVQFNLVRLDTRPLEFALELEETIPSALVGDELRIKQILNNLLSNAFKYTEKGKITLSAASEYGEGGKPYLVFVVSDTGRGMTGEQVKSLFDEYSRFVPNSASHMAGIGLGMSITKRLLELMGGSVSVKSAAGVGSVFTVRIPQEDAGAEPLGVEVAENLMQFRIDRPAPKPPGDIPREYMPYGSVLIVDDMESNLHVAKGLLAPYGLTLDTADSGLEAYTKVKCGKEYSLILMDHMMPGMDGVETCAKIRELGYAAPIVALTANAMHGQADEFMSKGFDGFISKPIDVRKLDAALNKLIRDRQDEATLAKARAAEKAAGEKATDESASEAEFYALFARDAEKAAATMLSFAEPARALSDEEYALYTVSAHAAKSALTNIGNTELAAAARRLEEAGRQRIASVVQEETADFVARLRTVVLGIIKKYTA
jgi:signal transduction histidine kinase/DNA-binding response OmpR family regulator